MGYAIRLLVKIWEEEIKREKLMIIFRSRIINLIQRVRSNWIALVQSRWIIHLSKCKIMMDNILGNLLGKLKHWITSKTLPTEGQNRHLCSRLAQLLQLAKERFLINLLKPRKWEQFKISLRIKLEELSMALLWSNLQRISKVETGTRISNNRNLVGWWWAEHPLFGSRRLLQMWKPTHRWRLLPTTQHKVILTLLTKSTLPPQGSTRNPRLREVRRGSPNMAGGTAMPTGRRRKAGRAVSSDIEWLC